MKRVTAKAWIFNESKNKVLIARTRFCREYGLVGGGIKSHENLQEALYREMREEVRLLQEHQ